MKLANVLYKLYCSPWLIVPEVHRQLAAIVKDHWTGDAHLLGGRLEEFLRKASCDMPMNPADDKDDGEDDEDALTSDGIAILSIDGVIGRKVSDLKKSSGVCDLLDVQAKLGTAMRDENCKGVMLVIDSPGGTVGGVPECAELIAACAAMKPVVSYCDGVMASAAYWLGSQADAVYSSKTGEIGSIGVYQAILDASRAYEMEGYKVELFKTGKFKGMGISGLPLTDEQRAKIQADVDQVFGWFTSAILAKRPKVPADAMQGQTFFGNDAKKMKLIDATGSELDAMAELRAMIAKRSKPKQ